MNCRWCLSKTPSDTRTLTCWWIDEVGYLTYGPREIGQAALAAMLDRIGQPTMTTRDILLNCGLVVRGSCGGNLA